MINDEDKYDFMLFCGLDELKKLQSLKLNFNKYIIFSIINKIIFLNIEFIKKKVIRYHCEGYVLFYIFYVI